MIEIKRKKKSQTTQWNIMFRHFISNLFDVILLESSNSNFWLAACDICMSCHCYPVQITQIYWNCREISITTILKINMTTRSVHSYRNLIRVTKCQTHHHLHHPYSSEELPWRRAANHTSTCIKHLQPDDGSHKRAHNTPTWKCHSTTPVSQTH
jgi:hypothetical protein